MSASVAGRVLVAGEAAGPTLVLTAPLSLWGGVDPASGTIVEERHPETGMGLAGHVLVMPAARGSSSSSSVLVELIRAGVGPLAIVLGEPDEILATGSVVAHELYGTTCPILVVAPPEYSLIAAASAVAIEADGHVTSLR